MSTWPLWKPCAPMGPLGLLWSPHHRYCWHLFQPSLGVGICVCLSVFLSVHPGWAGMDCSGPCSLLLTWFLADLRLTGPSSL